MITVMPLRGEKEKLYREQNNVPQDVTVFHAENGSHEWYPALRMNGDSV